MRVVGIDLAGPCNPGDTAVVWLCERGNTLRLEGFQESSDDAALFALARQLALRDQIAVGLDAPLSYNPGGGDRPADACLRKAVVGAGLRQGL